MSSPAAQGSTTPAPVTASAFLAAQEDTARKAIRNTIAQLKSTATGGPVSPPSAIAGAAAAEPGENGISATAKEMFNEHPFLSLVGATAAGFLTATAVVPSKEQQVLKKLAALERAVALQGGDVAHAKPGGNTLAGSLVNALAGVIKPVLLHTVTAALAAQTAADVAGAGGSDNSGGGEAAHNGHNGQSSEPVH